jgi:predicted nucleic acid-binding protein
LTIGGQILRAFFVDSSAFFALLSARDSYHAAAQEMLERVVIDRRGLVTTNFVVAETHALALARVGRHQASVFLRGIDGDPEVRIERATEEDEVTARNIVSKYDDQDFSLTDAISFAVMERLGIRTAFTFDRDFARFGFASVP